MRNKKGCKKNKIIKKSIIEEVNIKDIVDNNLLSEKNQIIASLKVELENSNKQIEKKSKENQRLIELILRLKDEYYTNLKDSIDSEEDALLQMLECKNQFNKIEKKFNIINNKYKALRNSKLGRLTIKYWEIKNKIIRRSNESK